MHGVDKAVCFANILALSLAGIVADLGCQVGNQDECDCCCLTQQKVLEAIEAHVKCLKGSCSRPVKSKAVAKP